MTRQIWCVLALAGGSVLANSTAIAGQAPGAAGAQANADAAAGQTAGQTQEAHVNTDPAQPPAAEGAQGSNEPAPAAEDGTLTSVPGSKALGMSILGNQDAPKSLVIVPWKTSELGGSPGVSLILDDSRQPVDRDVFMRALRYDEIRSGSTRHEGAAAGGRENAPGEGGTAQSTARRRER